MKLSVVIPVINEGCYLEKTLIRLSKLNPFEIIIVDGGSQDNTIKIAETYNCKILKTTKSRGAQISKGIDISRGDTILVMHADTLLAEDVVIDDFSLKEDEVGGFFRLKFDSERTAVKLVEFFANLRSMIFHLPYGDQGIFFRKVLCSKIGSFKNYPFLEDLDFIIRLRKRGKIKKVKKNIIVSARKLERGSIMYPILHSMKNVIIVLLFFLGFKPETLIKFYK